MCFCSRGIGGSRGGVRDARPPLGVQILSISCSFRENLACSRPPWRVHAPPSGKSWIRHCGGWVRYVWYQIPFLGVGMPGPRSLLGVGMSGGYVQGVDMPGEVLTPDIGPGRGGGYSSPWYWDIVIAIEAGSTHPTGMHSCSCRLFAWN